MVTCQTCKSQKFDDPDCHCGSQSKPQVLDSYLFDAKLWGKYWFGVTRIRHMDNDVVWFVHFLNWIWKLPIVYKGQLP